MGGAIEYLKNLPLRAYVVLVWFVAGVLLAVMVSDWWLVMLLFPLFWQVYLKRDLAPGW